MATGSSNRSFVRADDDDVTLGVTLGVKRDVTADYELCVEQPDEPSNERGAASSLTNQRRHTAAVEACLWLTVKCLCYR